MLALSASWGFSGDQKEFMGEEVFLKTQKNKIGPEKMILLMQASESKSKAYLGSF